MKTYGHELSMENSFEKCPFCHLGQREILLENAVGLAIADGYPVARGHALVFPRKHVGSVFDLSEEDLGELWSLVQAVRALFKNQFQSDGFTIGINDGAVAGQTIPHGHIHIIPRVHGDVPDPRGGVRWVIPAKAPYWGEGA